ncbi:glycosyltransferase [Methylocapsa polymorpha]|uniref:Glycosyltransferase n=1 Tax=Methylocapsa polymorpha TaxID=3080828 RepID=A0ABZ0HPT8_9HYPH|nr:glycosyltransferase [Methylocapsa sp. RX1]
MDQDHGDGAPVDEATEPSSGAPSADLPLLGKTVLLVHPAWHSCGSHQVFVSQARTYRSLGAKVLSLAVADAPGATLGSRQHRSYLAASADLEADARFFAGMPLRQVLNADFLRAARQWLHGNFAAILVETTKLVQIPDALASSPRIDLIHCNHFFCMPAARRLRDKHGCSVLLDTHDLQARQYALRNEAGWTLAPVASFEEMLAIELDAMRAADLLLHLNDEEAAAFQKLLPGKRHALLYPAVPAVSAESGGRDFIIIASANYANFLGVAWFLREVLPLAPDIPVKILGNIDGAFKFRAPDLLKRHAKLFRGRVKDLDAAYRSAAAILLPTTQGHGISIKTIEAMSSGAPLIATPHAFRGFGLDPAEFANVALASDAAGFAAALRRAAASLDAPPADRRRADTRSAYDRRFSFEAYRKALAGLVAPFFES